MVLQNADELSEALVWPEPGVTRIPYRLYADREILALEQQRIFRGPVWNFLCLEIDIPKPGDFKTSTVGEVPVVITRDEDGAIHAMVNRCAHKGALVCLKEKGNAKALTCIYHAWSYDLRGRLTGVAFRNGLRGKGGLPEDFDPDQHGLERLRVETFCGLVFGTFAEETPSVESYLGQPMSSAAIWANR
jgi:phenylpropionate dioxygenase-like ring-hydroxylating dioxygenase large terminal subunit